MPNIKAVRHWLLACHHQFLVQVTVIKNFNDILRYAMTERKVTDRIPVLSLLFYLISFFMRVDRSDVNTDIGL
jgi:hypothetical protein